MASSLTAATTLGKSEILGSPLQFTSPARAAQVQSGVSSSKIVALFSKKKKKPAKVVASPLDDELAKWYGPDRRIFLPDGLLDREEVPAYLTGEVPGE